jgi:hypothetical protein
VGNRIYQSNGDLAAHQARQRQVAGGAELFVLIDQNTLLEKGYSTVNNHLVVCSLAFVTGYLDWREVQTQRSESQVSAGGVPEGIAIDG